MAPARDGIQGYVKLERRLVLLAWLNSLLGYESNRELLEDMQDTAEGFDASGRSYVHQRLASRGDRVEIALPDLTRYDENIRQHLDAINAHRPQPITLRYFQHLAVLYAEIFLDGYFRHRPELLRSLNAFVEERNATRPAGDVEDTPFAENDLTKLAFWMATGSGKTLILHLNYRQFLHYNDAPLDNILLITPNEGLSEQHLEEMAASNIPCRRFNLNESSLLTVETDAVRVIEITKLVEQKRGGGVSVPVEAFEGNNLIFVDEGHKGAGGVAWRGFRDALGETGFTFEYSATFGQALTAAGNDELTAEYGKAIVFDYSYRYFHGDGFGKDFRILNLKEETTERKTETLMLGNLLSFYQQQRVFEQQAEALRPYNLEKPLWVFVGGSVNAVYTRNKKKRSDVLTVARFFHHLLDNKGGWAVDAIGRLLEGRSGLETPLGQDVFAGKFEVLRAADLDPEGVYQDVLRRVLQTETSGALHLADMRGSDGELGLKASGADEYFGLIYIGDTSAFKRLVEADGAGIVLEEDAVHGSLFQGINSSETTIEVLIGAKKFMEGWNSWRVSNMGLLNVGRGEGSEIIQLFGRGVRLRGKNFTLKRSSALDGSHPDHVRLLETLDIFAVRANYMAQFREYLEKEGVETEGTVQLPLFIQPNRKFLSRGLVVPRLPEDRSFAGEADVLLEPDEDVRVHVDMSPRVFVMESGAEGIAAFDALGGQERPIPSESLELVDWEQAYLDLLEYKVRKGLANLVIRPGIPREILERTTPNRLYELVADEAVVRPASFAGRARLQEAVETVLRKYVDAFYRARRERWDSNHMVYRTLDESDPNMSFNQDAVRERAPGGYVVNIQRSDRELISAVQALVDEAERLYTEETSELPRIHFDRHLYQPLPVQVGDRMSMSPPGLKESEAQLVRDLKDYWAVEKDKSLSGAEVFLLRNLSRGTGIGFFEERGFYPDFILWIMNGEMQHIVFVEPHGMIHAPAYIHDEKARLHEKLPVLAKEMGARSGRRDITLDSYILSATPFEVLRKRYGDGTWDRDRFASAHILFLERNEEYDYLKVLFSEQLAEL